MVKKDRSLALNEIKNELADLQVLPSEEFCTTTWAGDYLFIEGNGYITFGDLRTYAKPVVIKS